MTDDVPSASAQAPQRSSLGQSLRRLLRSLGFAGNGEQSVREAFQSLIEAGDEQGVALGPDEREMLLNLLAFGELRVDDVMVPRADIVAIEQATSLAEVVRVMREAGHSRLPIYRDTLDDVIGMVHVRDLLAYWGNEDHFDLVRIQRPLLFVPASMPVRDLLLQMRATRIHMALVVDEYGGTDGLVTIEDLVEEIVGEIHDEHDVDAEPTLVEGSGGVLEADARVPVEELEQRIGTRLLDEEQAENIDTLGGLVVAVAGRVPARGELVAHPSGLQFEIVDADPRRVKRLRIHHVPAAPPAAA